MTLARQGGRALATGRARIYADRIPYDFDRLSRFHIRPFVWSSPAVFLGVMARAWGECLGYLTGR